MTPQATKTVKRKTVTAVGVIETCVGKEVLTHIKSYGELGLFVNREDAAYFAGHDWGGSGPRPEVVDCEITFTLPTKGRKR